jgi:chromosomal replication initiation ATPase DnaA
MKPIWDVAHSDEPFDLRKPGAMLILLRIVARHAKLSPYDISSLSRMHPMIAARQVFCYLARHRCKRSYPRIGKVINRDHSTVMHGEWRVATNPERFEPLLSAVVAELERRAAP